MERCLDCEADGRTKTGIATKGTKNAKTQSRLRPISPFSYVGQGRKGERAL